MLIQFFKRISLLLGIFYFCSSRIFNLMIKKIALFFSVTLVLASCQPTTNKNTKATNEATSGVDVGALVQGLSFDIKTISYCYGQQVRFRANRESMGKVIENAFIDGYSFAKQSNLDLNTVNQQMYASKDKSERDPSFLSEFSKNIGLSIGTLDAKNLFFKNLDLVEFAEGFKDAGAYLNKVKVNPDSLIFKEQEKFNDTVGKRYLSENKKLNGIKTTASGLQYKVLQEGKGVHPDSSSEVTVHYTGKLITGEIFDSSVKRGEPITFNLQGVIKGWTEGLQLMNAGAKYEFYIPQELGYAGQSAGTIPPFSTLIFEVELISFK